MLTLYVCCLSTIALPVPVHAQVPPGQVVYVIPPSEEAVQNIASATEAADLLRQHVALRNIVEGVCLRLAILTVDEEHRQPAVAAGAIPAVRRSSTTHALGTRISTLRACGMQGPLTRHFPRNSFSLF